MTEKSLDLQSLLKTRTFVSKHFVRRYSLAIKGDVLVMFLITDYMSRKRSVQFVLVLGLLGMLAYFKTGWNQKGIYFIQCKK